MAGDATDAGAATAAEEPLRILIAPDPVLRRTARPVTEADAETVRALIPRMLATMYAAPGIGLAAPQVGVSLRLAVIDLQAEGRRTPMVLINPELVAASAETEQREEGCLSLPGQYADVVRPRAVTVRYLDESGARREVAAEGLLARCLQHEIDHLDGILFVDHLSALKRNIILRRLAKSLRAKAG
ncbi:peptide deformylase [Elioraea tepida]|jgi:peptide deformylase|uniref:Peptide deformylase n=1 Tax=Elioraea tepida TaxID=2843330 RepID=A0A975U153_9PROT|nr:peptide deformylase [Elioraea tepida]QXM24374.1 peptide deformylase [Elioraea tepida]